VEDEFSLVPPHAVIKIAEVKMNSDGFKNFLIRSEIFLKKLCKYIKN